MRSTLRRQACAAVCLLAHLVWSQVHKTFPLLQVAERAALIDEVAIGLITRVGLLLLAPHIAHRRVYRNTDRIVVFAAAGR